MATKFLRKIILQELNKVLNEDVKLRKGYNQLSDEGKQRVEQLLKQGIGEDEAIRQAALFSAPLGQPPGRKGTVATAPTPMVSSAKGVENIEGGQAQTGVATNDPQKSRGGMSADQLASAGMNAINAANLNTPIGKLQAAIVRRLDAMGLKDPRQPAPRGKKISNLPNNAPDGRLGPLTIAALKKITGKNYTTDYIAKNISNIYADMSATGDPLDKKIPLEQQRMDVQPTAPEQHPVVVKRPTQTEALIRKEIAKLLKKI